MGWGLAWPRVTPEDPGDRGGRGGTGEAPGCPQHRREMGMPPARGCHLLRARPQGVPGEKGAGVDSGDTCPGGGGINPHPTGTQGWAQPQPPAQAGHRAPRDTLRTPKAPARGAAPRTPAGQRLRGQGDTGTPVTGRFVLAGLRRLHPTRGRAGSSGGRDPHSWPGHSWPRAAGAGRGAAQLASAGRAGGGRGLGTCCSRSRVTPRSWGQRGCEQALCHSTPPTSPPRDPGILQHPGDSAQGEAAHRDTPGLRDPNCRQSEVRRVRGNSQPPSSLPCPLVPSAEVTEQPAGTPKPPSTPEEPALHITREVPPRQEMHKDPPLRGDRGVGT